ncbi:DUF6879 family protein [Streptomyces fimicarius]|uniref:DUF6879 family protein n=1 Tax=Streptomyces griseus TaxID=1911 RepID=UPI0036CDDC89
MGGRTTVSARAPPSGRSPDPVVPSDGDQSERLQGSRLHSRPLHRRPGQRDDHPAPGGHAGLPSRSSGRRRRWRGGTGSIAAGEAVRWLPRRRATGLALPSTDFREFDGGQVLFHHFTGNGQSDEDGREYTDDPVLVKLCADAFGAVWERAALAGITLELSA